MSKLIIQTLLSVVVAVSAVVGFDTEVKKEVNKNLREAKSFVHKLTPSIVSTTSSLDVEAEVSAEASLKRDLEAHVDSQLNAGLELDKTSKKSKKNFEPALSAEASLGSGPEADVDAQLNVELDKSSKKNLEAALAAESQAEVAIETDSLGVDVENELESILELETNILK